MRIDLIITVTMTMTMFFITILMLIEKVGDIDDADEYCVRVILILTKFGILNSTWFQIVPFGV